MDYRKEIDRLYRVDYGNPVEFFIRLVLILIAGLSILNYLASFIGLYWTAGYYAAHLLYFTILRTRPTICSRADYIVASCALVFLMLAYIWFPVLLFEEDDPALSLSAAAALGTFMIFVVRRADTFIWLVIAEVALVSIAGIVIFVQIVPEIQSSFALFFSGLSCLTLVGYFAETLQNYRIQRLETEAAAQRSIQAQKMEATGQLVGGVAHDFNNILTAVLGNLELYSEVPDTLQKDQFVKDAKTSAELAAKTIKLLMAYSRQAQLDVQRVPLTDIFEQLQNFSRQLLPSSIQIDFRPPEPSITILVDQHQLLTALINLIVNARDAISGNGQVIVGSRVFIAGPEEPKLIGYALKPGTYIEIFVTDDGPGIAPELLAKITTPFFTTKPLGKGSGLGLSMVEGFARQSGGGLKIKSSGRTTSVAILLPLTDQECT